jgi:hypothetical protein
MLSFEASKPRGLMVEAASALMLNRCAWHSGLRLDMRALRKAERTSNGLIIDAFVKSIGDKKLNWRNYIFNAN